MSFQLPPFCKLLPRRGSTFRIPAMQQAPQSTSARVEQKCRRLQKGMTRLQRFAALRGPTQGDDELSRIRKKRLEYWQRPDRIDVQGNDATDQGTGNALGSGQRRGHDGP